jgi:phage terminase large subunit-like protein
MRYAQDVYDNAMFGLRLGDKPRMLITTTPRPSAFMKKLVATEGVSITTSSTFDNAANLDAIACRKHAPPGMVSTLSKLS